MSVAQGGDVEEEELGESFGRLLIENGDEEDVHTEDDTTQGTTRSEEDEEIEDEELDSDGTNVSWSDAITVHNPWFFDDECGIDHTILESCRVPIDFFSLFFSTDMIDPIVVETNRYGHRYGQAKDHSWAPTEAEEIRKFVALCLQMGVVKLPILRDYWGSRPAFGGRAIA
ncbi:unnamed protein product [Cylicocyclus nassatus]|uniref:PiggyBac transposable element-derived protein domain-containing protein n=1 Tax=Cylicocyclus nassatus TaxID=53992 RepID=A0AA36GYE0_CYLNA|nr:unnamed protein product [Cylicocyclus nassatus]CAJ0600651.1 unnamed protein product [Cylicocyclus nassatus]